MTPLVAAHPMIPLGGMFFAVVGIGIVLGCILPAWRMGLMWAGLALGTTAIAVFGRRYAPHARLSELQIGSVALAICVEIAAFVALIRGFRRAGRRRELAGTLVIVGSHFLIMLPAFWTPILLLSACCLGNAALGWRSNRYPIDAMWAVDGMLKFGFGTWMLMQSPAWG